MQECLDRQDTVDIGYVVEMPLEAAELGFYEFPQGGRDIDVMASQSQLH
jgi:hypothetical protein